MAEMNDTAKHHVGPRMVHLFTKEGNSVAQVPIPDPAPGIIQWKGFYFRLDHGRYVQATVWEHME